VQRTVGDYDVRGLDVGPETRCAHYDGQRDVIALRFGCCERFYPCHACHDVVADHDAAPWPRDRFDEPAVLCGVCETVLTASAYLRADHECPACSAEFNPGCVAHHDRYFEGE
jgi:uncharacterized CHY-type Zn-finger protein